MDLGGGLHFHAGFVYDIKGASTLIDFKDKCLAVLLTNKTGDAALEVCSDHAAHGDMSSSWHTPPANFDRVALTKAFSRRATPAENKFAGWTAFQKKK